MLRLKAVFAVGAVLLMTCAGVRQACAKEESVGKVQVGDISVTLLSDAYRDLDAKLFLAANESQAAAIQKAYPSGKTNNSLNVFVIKTENKLVLVDTGGGTLLGPGAGGLPKAMAEAGINPADITDVVLTHVHRDHIGGLAHNAQAAFPKAMVHLSTVERDFWTSADNEAKAPERARSTFGATRDMLALYPGRISTFEPQAELFKGITPLAAYGHTPGHVAVLIGSKGEHLLIFGDLLHGLDLQTASPDIAIAFDSDPAQAIASRKALLARAAKEHWSITGVHVPEPKTYRIQAEGDGFKLMP